MIRKSLLVGTAIVTLMATAAFAAEQSGTQAASSETNEQKCARWASYQKLQGAAQAEYIKDCLFDLRVPEKKGSGGDD